MNSETSFGLEPTVLSRLHWSLRSGIYCGSRVVSNDQPERFYQEPVKICWMVSDVTAGTFPKAVEDS
jgi:hypothetical protein